MLTAVLCCALLYGATEGPSVVLHNGYGMVWDIWLLNSTHIIHITPTLSYIHHTAYYHSITYHLSPHPVHRSLLFLLACACCVVHPCPSTIHNPHHHPHLHPQPHPKAHPKPRPRPTAPTTSMQSINQPSKARHCK